MIAPTRARARFASAAERPLVIAHRGAWGLLPENSVPAIDAAARFDVIEIDVRLAADGTPYLLHDDTLDRTVGSPVAADGLSQDQLRTARLLAGAGGPGADETDIPIPTLEDALSAGGSHAIFDLDVKRDEDLPRVAAWVERHAARTRATLKIDVHRTEDIERLLAIEARYGITVLAKALAQKPEDIELLRAIAQANVAAAEIWFSDLELVRAASAVGPVLTTYTLEIAHCAGLSDARARVHPETVWGALRGAGIGGIMTDLPAELDAFFAHSPVAAPKTAHHARR
ncbi:MAG: glycerophosphodiester phosphodiesterase family protein [Pseudomonadota bacterium]